jgi:hypothetical protein
MCRWVVFGLLFALSSVVAQAGGPPDEPQRVVDTVQSWSGDYPVADLARLPQGQRNSRIGYLDDAPTFAAIWRVLKPRLPVPDVDFSESLVVFFRNVDFYNQIRIAKVEIRNGVAEVVAIETRSATAIKDNVAMALVSVPRGGVASLKAGDVTIAIPARR